MRFTRPRGLRTSCLMMYSNALGSLGKNVSIPPRRVRMRLWMTRGWFIVTIGLALVNCGRPTGEEKKEAPKMSTDLPLAAKIRRFAPTEITANPSGLSPGDRQALDKIHD